MENDVTCTSNTQKFLIMSLDGFRVRLADLQSIYTCSSKLVKYGSNLCMVGRGAHTLEVLRVLLCLYNF